jgi:hypothetical protein
MNKEQIFGIIRHLLTSVGGVIITNGYILMAYAEITGSIIAIVVLYGQFYLRRKKLS